RRRAPDARRSRVRDLRGHERDPAARDRARARREGVVRAEPATLGDRVRALRTAKGLTQGHPARRAGFSDAYISKIERVGGALRPSTVQRLAEALEVPPDRLADSGAN